MYPDEINALTGADLIFKYVVATEYGAIKYNAPDYRSIYFGIGLEMLGNADVKNQIINISRQWLTGEFIGVEYIDAMNALMSGQNYPNPASGYTFIPVSKEAQGGLIEVYNMQGMQVLVSLIGTESLCRIDLSEVPAGFYTYRIVKGSNVSGVYKICVVK